MQLRKEVPLKLVVNVFRKLVSEISSNRAHVDDASENLRHYMFAQAGRLMGMITKTDIVALSKAHFVHRRALAEERPPSCK